jgi:hypothetical protein
MYGKFFALIFNSIQYNKKEETVVGVCMEILFDFGEE